MTVKLRTCPYLGIKGDPKTALNFPSDGNCCYHARPIMSVDSAHQAQYCLSERHIACPVYRRAALNPLPASLISATARKNKTKRTLAVLALPLMVVASTVLVNAASKSPITASLLRRLTPSAQSNNLQLPLPASGLFGFTQQEITSTPYRPFTLTSTEPERPRVENCAIPEGWSPYIVKPTDSLFRLSVLYGISIQTLQEANCLGDQSVVLPGDIIYVPETPTATSTVTPQPTDTRGFHPPVVNTPQPPPSSNDEDDGEDEPPPPPPPTDTQAPPPPPPTTAPTEAPPTLAPTDGPVDEVPTVAPDNPPTNPPPASILPTALPDIVVTQLPSIPLPGNNQGPGIGPGNPKNNKPDNDRDNDNDNDRGRGGGRGNGGNGNGQGNGGRGNNNDNDNDNDGRGNQGRGNGGGNGNGGNGPGNGNPGRGNGGNGNNDNDNDNNDRGNRGRGNGGRGNGNDNDDDDDD